LDPTEALAALKVDPSRTGIFMDFDGTLSAIVPHPPDARLVPGAEDLLRDLKERFALVAIVSGRSLEDLRRLVSVPGLLLAGAYGRERSDRVVRRKTEGWETVGVAAKAAVSKLDGVEIERKGAGVALHFRNGPAHGEAVREIATILAREFSLDLRPGRMVYELVVPGPGKGDAIVALMENKGLEHALVAGDDLADVEAFHMVRDRGLPAVIVAVASAESPPGVTEAADIVVQGPDELVVLLRGLVEDG
jgi:trehalose 6-phosphate phosphatase